MARPDAQSEVKFVSNLRFILEKEGFLSKKEVGLGYGVADLILVHKKSFNLNRCKLRKRYKQLSPLLREEYFHVMKFMPEVEKKSVSIDYLLTKTHLSKSFLKYTILKSLEKKGYIKKINKKFYFKINGWLPLANEVIAIEAKIKNWKRGLIQANRYHLFADKVYLAVPKSVARLVDKKDLKKHNIGLISFDLKSKKKEIITESKKTKPWDILKRDVAIEYFWDRETLSKLSLV